MPFYYWIPVWVLATMFSIGIGYTLAPVDNFKMLFKEHFVALIIHQIMIFASIILVEIHILK